MHSFVFHRFLFRERPDLGVQAGHTAALAELRFVSTLAGSNAAEPQREHGMRWTVLRNLPAVMAMSDNG